MIIAQIFFELFAAAGYFAHGHYKLSFLYKINSCAANYIQTCLNPYYRYRNIDLFYNILDLKIKLSIFVWFEFDWYMLKKIICIHFNHLVINVILILWKAYKVLILLILIHLFFLFLFLTRFLFFIIIIINFNFNFNLSV